MITDTKIISDEGDTVTLQVTFKLSKKGYQARVMTIHGKGRWGNELPVQINGKPLQVNYQFGTK